MPRFLSGLFRALSGLMLTLVCLGAGAGSIVASSYPPRQPIWLLQNWIDWYYRAPQNAIALSISALGTAAGLAISVYQIWFSRAAKEAELRLLSKVKESEANIVSQIGTVQQTQKEATTALAGQIQQTRQEIQGGFARLDAQSGGLYTIPEFLYPFPETPKVFGHEQLIDEYCAKWLDAPSRRLLVYGSPNIGKSTIARAILRDPRSKQRFGIRRYELQCDTISGLENPNAAPAEALPRAMAAAWFGISGGTAEQITGALLSRLSAGATAILIDNFETLLNSPSPGIRRESRKWIDCLGGIPDLWIIVGVQGRSAPSSMPWELTTEVAPLSPADAIDLFCHWSRVKKHAADPRLGEILEAVDYVPYPVKLLGGIAQDASNLDVLYSLWKEGKIADRLRRNAGNREEAMEVSYDFAIQCLDEAALPALRILAWLPAGVAGADLAAVLPNGLQAEGLLYKSALAGREGAPVRLRMLKPLRDYVVRTRGPQPEEKSGAVRHYLGLAASLHDLSVPVSVDMVARLSAEFANVSLALDEALRAASPDAVDAACGLGRLSGLTGFGREESVQLLTAASNQAGTRQDSRSQARCLLRLGEIARRSSNYDSAAQRYNDALALFRAAGQKSGEAWCLWGLGEIARGSGDYKRAAQLCCDALPLFRAVQDKSGEAWCLLGLGEIARQSGDFEQAARHFNDALPVLRVIQDKVGEAWCLLGLSEIARGLSDFEEAAKHCNHALLLFRVVQDKVGEARGLWGLGQIASASGNYRQAALRFKEALPLYRAIQDKNGEAWCLERQGDLAEANGKREEIASLWTAALDLFQSTGDIASVARIQTKLRLP